MAIDKRKKLENRKAQLEHQLFVLRNKLKSFNYRGEEFKHKIKMTKEAIEDLYTELKLMDGKK